MTVTVVNTMPLPTACDGDIVVNTVPVPTACDGDIVVNTMPLPTACDGDIVVNTMPLPRACDGDSVVTTCCRHNCMVTSCVPEMSPHQVDGARSVPDAQVLVKE